MSKPIISTSGGELEIQIPPGTKTIVLEFAGEESTFENLRTVEFVPQTSASVDKKDGE